MHRWNRKSGRNWDQAWSSGKLSEVVLDGKHRSASMKFFLKLQVSIGGTRELRSDVRGRGESAEVRHSDRPSEKLNYSGKMNHIVLLSQKPLNI